MFAADSLAMFCFRYPCPSRSNGLPIRGHEYAGSRVFAALTVASVARVLEIIPPKPEGLVIALVGRIPMIPGSTAAKGLIYLFKFLQAGSGEEMVAAASGIRNLLEVSLALAAIGTALAIPQLILPQRRVPFVLQAVLDKMV